MIVLSKREKDTLREISQWSCFYANWKPKTRAKLEQMNTWPMSNRKERKRTTS